MEVPNHQPEMFHLLQHGAPTMAVQVLHSQIQENLPLGGTALVALAAVGGTVLLLMHRPGLLVEGV